MRKSSFWKEYKMDLMRSVCSLRFVLLVLAFAVFLAASDTRMLATGIDGKMLSTVMDIIDYNIAMDKFKVIMVILLACIYTKSFCDDYNSSYLRGILARIDVTRYAQSRVAANATAVVLGSLLGFAAAASVLSAFTPLISESYARISQFAVVHPILYLFYMGLVFGLVAAACSAVGLLFSAFQPNAFVSISLAGVVFFMAVSYMPMNSAFDIMQVILLMPSITGGTELQAVDMAWNVMYPVLLIFLFGFLFWKKLEGRVKNGSI